MSDTKARYYVYHEMTVDDMRRLDAFLTGHAGAFLHPSQIRPYKTAPGFKSQFGFASWDAFAGYLHQHWGTVRKYELHVFPSGDTLRNHPMGWITVRIQEYGLPDWSSDHYPSIELVNLDIQKAHNVRVFDLIRKELGLVPTRRQEYEDFREQMMRAVQRADVRTALSHAVRQDGLDLAVSGVVQLVESALRQKCLEVTHSKAGELTGIDLARVAYHGDQGCLNPPAGVASQATHGAFVLMQGFFLYIRNAFAHNAKVLGEDYRFALPVVQLCEFLLSMIEGSTAR